MIKKLPTRRRRRLLIKFFAGILIILGIVSVVLAGESLVILMRRTNIHSPLPMFGGNSEVLSAQDSKLVESEMKLTESHIDFKTIVWGGGGIQVLLSDGELVIFSP